MADHVDRVRKQIPATPPESPPVGFAGQNGFSTPLFPSKPNILYIMADQLAAPQLKMYNKNSQIKTPHLDKLAEQSVVFDSAYCNSPLCAPSRMAMITGQLPSKIGAYDNASPIPEDTPHTPTTCERKATSASSVARCTSSASSSTGMSEG